MSLHAFQDELLESPSLVHAFFSRKGGVSKGLYESLNVGLGSNDSPDNVLENRKRAIDALTGLMDEEAKIAPQHLLTVYQHHSNIAVTSTRPWEFNNAPKADAMVSNVPGLALGILTADCAPVLLADKHNKVIGAAHAGWKGALTGVLENTVKAMEKLGAKRHGILAVIGPCIAQNSYEVDSTFRDQFLRKKTETHKWFVSGKDKNHFQFDLPGFVRSCLLELDISMAENLELDTYSNESDFFSYRRATHRGEKDYGRQLSVIALT